MESALILYLYFRYINKYVTMKIKKKYFINEIQHSRFKYVVIKRNMQFIKYYSAATFEPSTHKLVSRSPIHSAIWPYNFIWKTMNILIHKFIKKIRFSSLKGSGESLGVMRKYWLGAFWRQTPVILVQEISAKILKPFSKKIKIQKSKEK